MRTSTPGMGGPTVPITMRSFGFSEVGPVPSVWPYTSAMGMPTAWKNFRISALMGAAPETKKLHWSRPRATRSGWNIRSSASWRPCCISSTTSSPACRISTTALEM